MNLLELDAVMDLPECADPPQFPVTALDIDRSNYPFDMMLPMADPCPACGAFNMRVGDYVSFGICLPCVDDDMYEI